MNKTEFLAELEKNLNGLPKADIDERLSFYSEMIDDKLEEGQSEEEIIAGFGPVEDIAAQIIGDTPIVKIVKEKAKPKRALRTWEVVLIVLGFPVWGSILVALVCVAIAVVAVFFSVLASLWAVCASVLSGSLAGLGGAVISLINGEPASFFALLGAALVCAGLGIIIVVLCILASKGLFRLFRAGIRGLKKAIVKGGDKQ